MTESQRNDSGRPTLTWPEQVKQQSRDRERLSRAFEHHLLTPDCKGCRDDFDAKLAAYRKKYA